MNESPVVARLRRDVRFLRIWAILSTTAIVLLAVHAFRGPAGDGRVIDVDRINVRNADGGLALAIAGQGGLPGPTFGGREYSTALSGGRTTTAGMIFFNESGDEVGGLTFHGDSTADGYSAGGHFSFDQFQQDQVVALQYVDDGANRRAGVTIWDRSTDIPLSSIIDLLEARLTAEGAARDSIEAQIQSVAGSGLGATRAFLGSRDRVAQLVLNDSNGRPRIRLYVDSLEVPRMEFLDAAGATVRAFE